VIHSHLANQYFKRVRFEVFAAVTMPCSGMFRRLALVRTDVSEEVSPSIIRVTTIGELGTLAVTRVGCYLRLTFLVHRILSL
jgi:hypothetical protein